jgi:ribosomal protein L24
MTEKKEEKKRPRIESFRRFVNEVEPKESDIYSIDAILVISGRFKRSKGDILSDIRAIEGVTIVSVHDQKDMADMNYSQIKIKIDTTPLRYTSVARTLLKIKREVMRVTGVTRFEYTSTPAKV